MIKTSLIYSFYAWVKNVIRCVLGYLKFSSIYHSFVTLRPHRAKINLDVLIIGGGNSFTDEMSFYIREHRASFVIVVINHYYKNSLSRFLIPDYYLVSDPRVIMPSNDADVSDNERLKRYIRRHSVKLITPYSKLWLKKYSPDLFFNDDQCLHALSRQPYFPRPIPSNSLLKAVWVFKYLASNNLFIFGFNYDYPKKIYTDMDNKLYLENDHHYGSSIDYLGEVYDSVADALYFWSLDFYYFSKLDSSNIINVTENSSLPDFFQKINFSDFIEYASTKSIK